MPALLLGFGRLVTVLFLREVPRPGVGPGRPGRSPACKPRKRGRPAERLIIQIDPSDALNRLLKKKPVN